MTETPIVSEMKPRDRRALNAYRHGLTGQVLILTPDDQAAYLKHSQGIQESLAPEGAMEAGLVQSVADDRWRLARAGAMENSILAAGLGDGRPTKFTDPHEQIDVAFAQAVVWLKEGNKLALLTLYEGRIQRRVEKNLATLRQLQQDRKAALQQAVEEAELLAQLAASKGETFDIERDFPRETLPPQFVSSLPKIARIVAHRRRLAAARKPLCKAA